MASFFLPRAESSIMEPMDADKPEQRAGRNPAWALGLCGLLAAALSLVSPRPVPAQQLINVTATGDVSWPASRHVFYDPGIGTVFVFYSQPYGIAYRSYNFGSWSAESVVISTGNALALDPVGATNSNTMYSSLYYDQASSSVYVIASDPNALLEKGSGGPFNSVFMLKGTLPGGVSCPLGGPICWGSIIQRAVSFPKVGNGTGECAPGMNVGITYIKGAASPVSWVCDAQCINGTGGGNPSFRTSIAGQDSLSAGLSGGSAWSADKDDGNQAESTIDKQYGLIVPVNDTGSGFTYGFVTDQHDRSDYQFADRSESYQYSGTWITREFRNNNGTTGAIPLVTDSMAPQPDAQSSVVSLGGIDTNGALGYSERTANGTWNAETVIDACSGLVTTPCGNPSTVYVGNTPRITPQGNAAFMVYLSSYGSVNYGYLDVGQTLVPAVVPNWQPSANGDSVPQAPAYVNAPDPIPVVWDNSSGGVDFEFIPTDNVSAPTIASISSSPATAPFSTNAYDLIINGTGFLHYDNARTAQVAMLLGGNPQTGVTVTSTTFVSATQIRASVIINSNSGSPYDIQVTNPDGRTVLDSQALTLPIPDVTSAAEDVANHHLTSQKYDLIISGSGFEDWVGTGAAAVTLLKGGVSQSEITVTSTTYVSQSQIRASIVLNPPISGGPYDVKVTNADGQTFTLSSAYSIPAPTLTGVYIVGASSTSAGIEPAIPDCAGLSCPPTPSGRPTRQLTLVGTNFENWGAATASAAFSGAGVFVDSVTYANSGQMVANVNVTTAAASGLDNVNVINADGEASSAILSTFTVTLPTATITYPALNAAVSGANFSSGWENVIYTPPAGGGLVSNNLNSYFLTYDTAVAQVQGSASYLPASGQTSLLNSQVKIEQLSGAGAGYFWNDSLQSFQAPTSFSAPASETEWASGGAGTPWSYAGWAASGQSDGTSYALFYRARSADNGWSYPVSTMNVVAQSAKPTAQINNPLPSDLVVNANGVNYIGVSFDDALTGGLEGAGITQVAVLIKDTNTFSWTGSSWSLIPGDIYITTNSTSMTMEEYPPIAPINLPAINATTFPQLPAFNNGAQYTIKAKATDAFGNQTSPSASESFYYDVSNPTVTVTAPIISQSSATPTWLNSFVSVSGGVNDAVLAVVNTINVYVQISDVSSGLSASQFLTAADTFTPTAANAGDNYWYIPFTANNSLKTWQDAISGVPFLSGHKYRVAIYACDSAAPGGNCTGNDGANSADPNGSGGNPPAFIGFFNFTNLPPLSAQIFPTNIAPLPNAFGDDAAGNAISVSDIFGTAQDGGGTAGIQYEEYQLADVANCGGNLSNIGSCANFWFSASTAPGNGSYTGKSPIPGFFALNVGENIPWNIAGTTMTGTSLQWEVWHATGIPWASVNGHEFQLVSRAVDAAGNIQVSYSTTVFTYDSSAPVTSLGYPTNAEAFSAQISSITGTVQDEPSPYNSGVFKTFVGIQRQSDGQWWTSAGWSPGRADIPTSLNTGVNPNQWSYNIPASFWTPITAESPPADRFLVYAWSEDNVQAEVVSSTPSVENVESSATAKIAFEYDVVPPSSTVSSPIDQNWYSNVAPYTLSSLTGTAVDNPSYAQTKSSSDAAGLSEVKTEIRDETDCILNSYSQCKYWTGSQFLEEASNSNVFNLANIPINGNPSYSTWTFSMSALISGGDLVSGHQYRVRSQGIDSSVDQNGNPAGNAESPPNIQISQDSPVGVDANVHFFQWDSSAPATVIQSPADGSQANGVSSISGTAADTPLGVGNNAGLGTTYIAVCQSNTGACSAGTYLTALSAGSFSGTNPVYFPVTPSCSSGINAQCVWSLSTTGVPWTSGQYYDVLSYSTDVVNNAETPLASDAANSNHVQFKFVGGSAAGHIQTPSPSDATFPWYEPANLATISGTAQGATDAWMVLEDTDTQQYWSSFQSAWVNVSTAAHAGVISGTSWSDSFGLGNWQVNHNYFIGLIVCNSAGGSCSSNSCALATPANCLDHEQFVIDSSAPLIAVTLPSASAYRAGTLGALSGTVVDVTAPNQSASLNVASVYYRVVQSWNSDEWSVPLSTFVAAPGTNLAATAGGGDLFTYTTSYLQNNTLFKDGYQYQVNLFASDLAGNSAEGLGSTFRWDVTVPTAAVTVPIAPPVFVNSISAISGTAIDQNPNPGDSHSAPSGLAQVGVLIQNQSNHGYFNGSNFTSPTPSTQTASCAGQTCSWIYAPVGFSTAEFSDGFYTLTVIAQDNAGNVQNSFGLNFSSFTFAVDKTPPTISIAAPNQPDYSSATIVASGISGVASDPVVGGVASGLRTGGIDVQLWYLQAGTSYYWTGGSWAVGVSTLTNTVASWSLLGVPTEAQWETPGDDTFYVQARAHDNSTLADGTVSPSTGNVSAWFGPVSFIVDDTPPISTMTWPSNGIYADAISSMTGTMSDNLSGIQSVQVRITTNPATGPDWNGSAYTFAGVPVWRPATVYVSTWAYPGGTGDSLGGAFVTGQTYDLEVRAQDNSGNLNAPSVFTVAYDTTPAVSMTTPVNNQYVTGFSQSTGAWSDPAGLSSIQVAVEDVQTHDFWNGSAFQAFGGGSWQASSVYPSSWVYTSAALSSHITTTLTQPHAYIFFVRAVDTAGNDSAYPSGAPASGGNTMNVDFFPPTSQMDSPAPGAYVNGLVAPILGTADDQSTSGTPGVGVNQVQLKIFRVGSSGTTNYWNLTDWSQTTDQGFNAPTALSGGIDSIGNWNTQSASLPESAFDGTTNEGYLYSVVPRGTDILGNIQGAFSTGTFLVDRTTPTVTMSSPLPPDIYISTAGLSFSSGTFTDPAVGGLLVSGVKQVLVELEDVSGVPHTGGTQWWNANTLSWGSEVSTTAVLYASSWTFTNFPPGDTSSAGWTRGDSSPDGRTYVLRVLAQDRAGNAGVFPNTNVAAATIVFDGTLPNAGITAPALGGSSGAPIVTSLGSIAGTASDPAVNGSSSGVAAVYVSIQGDPGNSAGTANLYYDNQSNAWVSGLTWNPTSWNGTNWSFSSAQINSSLEVNGKYILISTAADNAGNIQSPRPVSGAPGYVEVTFQPPPAVTAIVNPQKNVYYNALANIVGTANGNTATVELQIQRDDTVQCWGGAASNGWISCGSSSATLTGVPTAGNWSFPFYSTQTVPGWINNASYTLTETGYNSVNLAESPNHTLLYYIDESSPTASVGYPTAGSYINVVPTLTGAAQDPVINGVAAGVLNPGGVSVWLQRTSDGDYWNQQQSTWTATYVFGQSTAAYFTSGSSWTFVADVSTLAWQNGTTYKIEVQAEDNAQGGSAGNIGNLTAPITFTYDTTPPGISITQPAGALFSRQSQMGTIAGGASVGEAPLSQVQVRAQDLTSLLYSNPGGGFAFSQNVPDSAWFAASLAGVAWSTADVVPFVEGSTYAVSARSEDLATNYSVPYATFDFVYDALPPVSAVTEPSNNSYLSALGSITGTVEDQPFVNPGTVVATTLRIERLDTAQYWTGIGQTWSSSLVTLGPTSGVNVWQSSWSLNASAMLTVGNGGLVSGTSYYITAASTDNAIPANLEAFDNAYSSTFTFDDTAPTSVVVVPKNNGYENAVLTVSGTSGDNVGVS
ncbi:MAG: hypothetical protein ACYCPQ_10745, partial [Elusimicrobiota bacterium]